MTRLKDAKFGEAVALLVEGGGTAGAEAACRRALPKYWQPRRVFAVAAIPLTATGKPARKQAEELAASLAGAGTAG